jgi:glycosyltransferase involved in cell wall biosynthesis
VSPAVTVVIPVFNRAVAVRAAIGSVLAQTFQDFEINVVDDGSTDRTASVVAALEDPRIRVIRHAENRGGSAARNSGIRAGSAPFVAFLDSDDEWLPTKLERQLAVFARTDDRLALVYAGTERRFQDGTRSRYIPRRRSDLASVLLTENVIGESSVGMVRRSVLDAIGGFDESLPWGQDLDLWLRICQRFDAEPVPEVLVKVEKGDDAGRISSNVRRTILGRELFLRKHEPELIRRGVLYLYLRESGWWQQRRMADPRRARSFYRESLKANAAAPLTYVLLAMTYLPLRSLNGLARFKHFVIDRLYSVLTFPRLPGRRSQISFDRNRSKHTASS